MGTTKAKEALIFGKKMTATELLGCGFLKSVTDPERADDAAKRSPSRTMPPSSARSSRTSMVRPSRSRTLTAADQLETLDPDSVLVTKQLINAATAPEHHAANLREIFAGIERFESGKPQRQFAAIANKTFKHKL